MFEGDLSALARGIGTAVTCVTHAALTDRDLLARYANARDELAFAVLVGRHGRLVEKVCRNLLRHEHDAEDATQATFLVLARKAHSLHHLESLAGWLHRVAYRTAQCARRDANRRRAREARVRPAPALLTPGPMAAAETREQLAIVDAEVQRLPERLRTVFVLCVLEGLSHEEAARRLRLKTKTFSSRLDAARKRLKRRLDRRGVGLSAVPGGLILAEGMARAGVPAARTSEITATAQRFVKGEAVGPAGKLAKDVLRGALWTRLKAVAIGVLVAGTLGTGLGAYSRSPEAPTRGQQQDKVAPPAPEEAKRQRLDFFGDPLPDGALGRFGTMRFGHDFYTESTVWSPDGKIIASLGGGSSARPLCLWDAATGRELHQLAAKEAVWAAAFSRDGKVLAATEGKRGIVLWDVASGNEIERFTGQGDGAGVAFAPDGRKLAAAFRAGVIQIRDVTSGRLDFELKARGEPPLMRVAYAPDGRTLASTCYDGTVMLWDLATGTERWRRKAHGDWAYGVAFAPDGKTFATTGADHVIRIWDVFSGASPASFGKPDGMLIAYSPDGRTLASPGPGDFVSLWDPSTGQEKRRWHTGEQWLQSVSYSPDGRKLATTGFYGSRVRLWDPQTGTELRPAVGHRGLIHGLSFSPDGKTVWSAASDKAVISWDAVSGQGQALPGVDWNGYSHTLAFSTDGTSFATGGADGSIRLWDASGQPLGTLTGHRGGVITVAFSPDGKILASSGADHTVRFWDAATNRELGQTQTPDRTWGCLVFSPDGLKVALAHGEQSSERPAPMVLDVLTGNEILRLDTPLPAPDAPAASEEYVTFSPDGSTLATVGKHQDTVVRLRDAATGKLIGRCSGETKCRTWSSVSFSPDGRLLAAAPYHRDNSVHLWEVATCQEVACLQGHHGGITALAFSPDSRSLASGGGDGTVLVWDLTGHTASAQRRAGQLSLSQLERCWSDLRGEDAAAAYRAVQALAADPMRSVPFLAGCLRPTECPAPAEAAGLLADLNAAAEWLRQRRAVMALEYSATSEARQLLQTLAMAEVATPLAAEARAALLRLNSPHRMLNQRVELKR